MANHGGSQETQRGAGAVPVKRQVASSEERLATAARLRNGFNDSSNLFYTRLVRRVFDDIAIIRSDGEIFNHLAELIDPTCEAAYDNPFASDFNYRCMACGEHFSTCGEPRYCPGCGGRIEHVK